MRHALVAPIALFALGLSCASILGVHDAHYGEDGGAGDGGSGADGSRQGDGEPQADGASGDAGSCPRLQCPPSGCSPTVFANDTVNSLAIGGGSLYWVNGNGDVVKQPVDGGPGDKTGITTGSAQSSIALDADGTLYVADQDAGTVSKCSPACTTIANGFYRPRGIAVDAQYVYVGTHLPYPPPSPLPSNVGVYKVPKGGGAVALLSNEADMDIFAVDDKRLFFAQDNACTAIQMPKDTPQGAFHLDTSACNLRVLAVDQDAVYVAGKDVQRITLRQGAWPGTIPGVDAQGMTVDCAGDLYWTTTKALWRVATSAFQQNGISPPPELLASEPNAEQVAADASGVFWATDNGIMKLAR